MSGGSYDYIYSRLEEKCSGRMYDAEMDEMIKDICQVLHDLEWWQSSDCSENEYRATLDKFKAKWFKGNREGRLKGYIDNQIGILRKQLYALIGEPIAESKHSTIEELEKEPCEDAISRADIIEEIEKLRMSSGVTNQSTWNECVDVILSTIKNKDWFPSVQPTLIKASDIQPDDEWMQEDMWDEIYEKESEVEE